VDGFEEEMNGEVQVIHLNLLSGVGRATAVRYTVPVTPTTLLFNRQGILVDRQMGMPDTVQLRDKMIVEGETPISTGHLAR
jgi:hypothetical protein